MGLRDTFLNVFGMETQEVQKTDNSVFKSSRDFLKYGNRERLYPSWSDIKMPDSDLYRGYSYAVIQKRSNKVATLAKQNLKTTANKEIVDEFQKRGETVVHPYLKLIEDSTDFTEKQFWKNISIYLDLAGRYYLGVIRNQIQPLNPKLPTITTDPVKFVMLNPYEIRRVVDKDKHIAGYIERKKDGRYREWSLHQIIEMRELDPFDPENGHWAMTDAAKEAVYTINQSGDYTRQSLNGNIDAPGIITTDVLLSDEDFANFRARVTQHAKGEPLFGNGAGAIKWDSMQVDLDKAALLDINEINRTELFAVSGTSKTSLGIEQSGTTRETARVQSEQFVSDTAQPRLEDIIDFLNLDYKKHYKSEYQKTGYYIEVESAVSRDYDTEQKATSLKQSQFQLAMQLIQSGYTTESAYQFAEGEIDFADLELEKGLDKPRNPEQPEEPENPDEPKNPSDNPQGGSSGPAPEGSLDDLNGLEPHGDLTKNGGPGSGNFDHAGRPGEVGGSAPEGSIQMEKIEDSEDTVKLNLKKDHPILKAMSSKGIGRSLPRNEVEEVTRKYLEDKGFDFSEDSLVSLSDKGNEKAVLEAIEHGRLTTAKHIIGDVLADNEGWHNPRTFGKDVELDIHGMKDGDEFTQSKKDYREMWQDFDKQVDSKLNKKKKNSLEGEERFPLTINGGVGSGNFGHSGRPGEVGGSGKKGYKYGTLPDYSIKPKEGYAILYTNTKASNLDSINEKGLLVGQNMAGYKASPEEGMGIWTDVRSPESLGYGGCTIAFQVPEEDAKTFSVNSHQCLIPYDIKRENILFIDKAYSDGPMIKASNIMTYVNKYGKEHVTNVLVRAGNDKEEIESLISAYEEAKREKNSLKSDDIPTLVCTCNHAHKIETYVNELGDDGKKVKDAHDQFLKEVRAIEKETINAVANKLTINAFAEDDLLTPKKKDSLLNKLQKIIYNYWWALTPVFATNAMNIRNEEFDEDVTFTFTNDIESKIGKNADRVAEGHLNTILGDILEVTNNTYSEIQEEAAAKLVVDAYKKNPTKYEEYFEKQPSYKDALEAVQRTDILEKNRKIYEEANKMAFDGYKREDIVKAIREEYTDISQKRAELIANNEASRAFTQSQFESDRQFLNAIGKMDQAYKVWYSRRPANEQDKICDFCNEMIRMSEENPIPFEEPFLEYGNSMEVMGADGKLKIFTANYEDIEGGVLHPNCQCGYHLVFKNDAGEFVKTLNKGEKEIQNDTSNSVGLIGNNCGDSNDRNNEPEAKTINGGAGSGNFGHQGRPGLVGGSSTESYETLREQESAIKSELELLSGSNDKQQMKEFAGTLEMMKEILEHPENFSPEVISKMKEKKEVLDNWMKNVLDRDRQRMGEDLTPENYANKYDQYVEQRKADLEDVYKQLGEIRNEKKTLDLTSDSQTPDMDYIGSEKQRLEIAKKTIGTFEDSNTPANDWLEGEIGEAKPKIRKAVENDKALKQACLSQMYYDSGSKMNFKDWLNTPTTLSRVQYNDKINKDSGFLSFSQHKDWQGVGNEKRKTFPGDILEIKIKPQDTLGSIPTHEGFAYAEKEVMVPTELIIKALKTTKGKK